MGCEDVYKMDAEKINEYIADMQLATFKNGVKLTALMQATIEHMDTMKHTAMYKQKIKKQMKALEAELEKTVLKPLSSLDATDEEMVTRIQSNIEVILNMTIEELGGLKVALDEHRAVKEKA